MNGDKRIDPKWWGIVTIFSLATALGIVLYIYLTGSAAPSDQTRPKVAYLDMGSTSKGVHLATWTDQRNGNNDIVGAIINPRATTVKTNFPITAAPASQAESAIAANTTNQEFLVVWQDQRNGPFRDIYAQRVRYDKVLQGNNFAISTASNDQTDVAVAYNSTKNQYLVVWQDYRNTSTTLTDIYGQLVSHDGKLMGKNFVISNHPANAYESSVAYNSTNDEFLIVWEDDRSKTVGDFNIYGQRLSAAGKLLGGEISISTAPKFQTHPEIAYNTPNKTYLVVWQDLRNSSTSGQDVYGQRIRNTGALEGGNFAISTAPSFQGGRLSVASEAQSFLISFDDTRNLSTTGGDIYAQRVSVSGSLLGGNFAVSNQKDAQSRSAVAHAGMDASYLVIWEDWRNLSSTGMDIYGQHLAIDGSLVKTGSNVNFLVSVPAISGQLKP